VNAGILPLILLCAALGLALSRSPARTALLATMLMSVAAFFVTSVMPDSQLENPLLLCFWIVTAFTAALVYLPRGLIGPWALLAGLNAGVWLWVAARMEGGAGNIVFALPATFLVLPGSWLFRRGYGVGCKVVASWIIAISLLAGMVSMTPTPGYVPDHME
jgi:hypothetical protein